VAEHTVCCDRRNHIKEETRLSHGTGCAWEDNPSAHQSRVRGAASLAELKRKDAQKDSFGRRHYGIKAVHYTSDANSDLLPWQCTLLCAGLAYGRVRTSASVNNQVVKT
jgi:hypothetical protein